MRNNAKRFPRSLPRGTLRLSDSQGMTEKGGHIIPERMTEKGRHVIPERMTAKGGHVIPENLRSRFIRDPGNALVPRFDSLDSGYRSAIAERFRNDMTLFPVIPEFCRRQNIRDPGNVLVPRFDSLDSGYRSAIAERFRNDGVLAERFLTWG